MSSKRILIFKIQIKISKEIFFFVCDDFKVVFLKECNYLYD